MGLVVTPLENYYNLSDGQRPTQSYIGNHQTILDRLSTINQQNVKANKTSAEIWTRYPSLLINSTNDYKTTHNLTGKISTELVLNATKVATQIYKEPQRSQELITEHKKYIETKKELNGLLSHQYRKVIDLFSVQGSKPERSRKISKKIQEKFKGEDILFLALGNGGTNPGLEIFTIYEQETGNKNSQFYPIRFSRVKKEDKEPRLTKNDKQYLKDLNPTRIILFDEDTSTGDTIVFAKDYISKIFPNQQIITAVNYYTGQKEYIAKRTKETIDFLADLISE